MEVEGTVTDMQKNGAGVVVSSMDMGSEDNCILKSTIRESAIIHTS